MTNVSWFRIPFLYNKLTYSTSHYESMVKISIVDKQSSNGVQAHGSPVPLGKHTHSADFFQCRSQSEEACILNILE